jgi:hypothetical protein|nr:energy transducer TonB [Kofleriaceae bacterium]
MRKRPWLVPISLAAHLAAGVGLYAAGVWTIERLPVAHADNRIGTPIALGDSAGGQPAAAKRDITKKKQIAKTITQPEHHVDTQPVATVSDTGDGSGSGGSGDGSGSGTGETGGCLAPPCEAAPPPQQPPPPPEPPKPPVQRIVPPNLLQAAWLSGERDIHPPDPVVTQMTRDGVSKATGIYKICLDERGAVTTIKQLRSTGYDVYDRRLESGMSQWRYRPVQLDGHAIAACGTVTFIYEIH